MGSDLRQMNKAELEDLISNPRFPRIVQQDALNERERRASVNEKLREKKANDPFGFKSLRMKF